MVIKDIWIYDDDAIIEGDLKFVLSQSGFHVKVKTKVEMAESPYDTSHSVDLLISNIKPFQSIVRNNEQKLPLILITGLRPFDLNIEINQLSYTTLYKPFLPHQLIRMIDSFKSMENPIFL